MGRSKKRRGYQTPSIGKSLDPYHYPLDAEGNPTPTPSPRSNSAATHPTEATRDRPVDEPAVSGIDEHIIVDLTSEGADVEPPGTTGDSVADHFARIVTPRPDPKGAPVGDPDQGTAHAG
jgi:hypothetical protein